MTIASACNAFMVGNIYDVTNLERKTANGWWVSLCKMHMKL